MSSLQDVKQLISAVKAAEILGVSSGTLHSWCKNRLAGDFTASPKFYQLGRKRMFYQADVEDWLKNQKQ